MKVCLNTFMRTFAEYLAAQNEGWQPVRFRASGGKPHQTVIGGVKLKLMRNPETNEFIVAWIERGRIDQEKSYFTNDGQDAMKTMDDMARRLIQQQQGENGLQPKTSTPVSPDQSQAIH